MFGLDQCLEKMLEVFVLQEDGITVRSAHHDVIDPGFGELPGVPSHVASFQDLWARRAYASAGARWRLSRLSVDNFSVLTASAHQGTLSPRAESHHPEPSPPLGIAPSGTVPTARNHTIRNRPHRAKTHHQEPSPRSSPSGQRLRPAPPS